ncbi:hypothetical protein BCR35DRAFT_351272 [Leucosporidium creatinivorum]|uniref:Uncharacterized protein n=1 Tax=Leucosporidium creatinivorum TaxID=106004 RepID=A0A1Y2FZV3_9BASI|nr:hypothetical protein BCR35DRAFT_351272 [Leucosporidium creatinivorum]
MDQYTSGQPVSLGLAEALIGPILIGAMLQIGLYGFLLSYLINLRSSPTWTRSRRITRTVCYGVVLLNTGYTGLTGHTIWYWGTLPERDYHTIAGGEVVAAAGPIVLTTIAVIVQMTLAVRSSRIMKRAIYRYIYITVIGCTGLVSYLGAIVLSASSLRWHFLNMTDWVAGLSLKKGLMIWMWSACSIDLTITTVYLIQLRRTLWGKNSTSDSVFLLIGRLVVRSAAYTAVFAALVAIMTQLFCDSMNLFGLDFVFCIPLASLYTLSLFTTLTIPDVVERELGGHIARVQKSHPSALLTLSSPAQIVRAPVVIHRESDESEVEQEKDSEKAFGWARLRGPSVGGVNAEGLP